MNSYPHEPWNKWDRDKPPTALQLHDTCISSAERRERKQQSSVIGAWEQNNKTANRDSLQSKNQRRNSSGNWGICECSSFPQTGLSSLEQGTSINSHSWSSGASFHFLWQEPTLRRNCWKESQNWAREK